MLHINNTGFELKTHSTNTTATKNKRTNKKVIAEWAKNLYKTATHSRKETKHKTYAHCLLWYMLYWCTHIKWTKKRESKYERSLGQFCLQAVSSSVSLLPISIFNGTENGKTGDHTSEHTCMHTHSECVQPAMARLFLLTLVSFDSVCLEIPLISCVYMYVCVPAHNLLSIFRSVCLCTSFFPFN